MDLRWSIHEKNKKVALCYLAASILVLTAVLVFLITPGMNLSDALLYGLALPLLIFIVYILISRNASRKIRLYTIIANPTIPVALLIACAIVGAFFILWVGGSVSADLEDRELEVSAPFVDEEIAYQDINKVELRNDVDYGSRRSGYAGNNVLSGNFKNDEF